MNDQLYFIAIASYGFVDAVINDLINQMMQSFGSGRTDIHTRPFADRLQSLQNLNIRSIVRLISVCIAVAVNQNLDLPIEIVGAFI
jgi:hypothetical protein